MLGRKTLWASQPQNTAPLAHSFYKSLIGVVYPFGAHGRARVPQLGSTSILSTGNGGIGLQSDGTATGHISLGANLSPPGFVCTMLCVFRFIPGTFSDLLSTDNSSSTNYIGHSFYANSTGAVGVLMGDGGVAGSSTRRSIDTSSTPLIANAINTVAFAIDSNTTARIWVNGVLQPISASGSGTGYAPGTTGTASIGRSGQTSYTTADVLTVGIWSEAFNSDFLREWSREPWQLFESLRGTVPHYFATGQRIHYIVYPASETRYPQAKDVIDGWPGVATTTGYEANRQSDLVNFYVEAEGLLDNTSYKIAYVWYDGVNVSDVVVSDPFSTLSGATSLTADNAAQVSTSATGVITQIQVLVTSGSTQDSTSGTGSIASLINLTVDSDIQSSTAASVVITQNYTISVGSDSQTNSATTDTVSQVHVLVSADSIEDSTSSIGSITQLHVLTVASNTQSSTSSSGSVVLTQTLTSESNTQDSISGTDVTSQIHIVSVGSDTQVSTSATAVVTQTHILVASNCSQDSTSSTGTVTNDGTLVAAPSSQDSTSNSVSVTQVQILAGSDSSQSNSDNNAVITQVHIVSATSCTSDGTSGTGIVSVGSGLVGSSCTQNGSSSSSSITQAQIIVVDNCNSTNNSSNSDITQVNVITAANCIQAESSEAVALTQIYNTILASICTEDATSSSGLISIEHILSASTFTQDSVSLAAAITLVHQLLAENVNQSNNSSSPSLTTSFYVPGTVVAQNEPKRLFILGTRTGVTVTVVNPTRYIRASG